MGTDRWIKALVLDPFTRQRLRPLIHEKNQDDLMVLKELIEAGTVTPFVDRQYELGDAPAAIQSFEK